MAEQALQVIENETGELIEVNIEGAEQATSAELREATPLKDIKGPVAIIGINYGVGKNFDGEYAEVLAIQSRKGGVIYATTASQEMIATFRRCQLRGLGQPNKPLMCKFDTAKTSSGFTVHKVVSLTPAEVASLTKGLKGDA